MGHCWGKKATAMLSLLFLTTTCFGSWFMDMKSGAFGGLAASVLKKVDIDWNASLSERALSIESDGDKGTLPNNNYYDDHDDENNGSVNTLLFLEAPPSLGKHTGLGDNFLNFNHFVTVASKHNLAIRTTYTTIAHHLKKKKVLQYFFGTQTMAPVPENCTRKQVTIQSLPGDVTRAKSEGKCVVFMINELDGSARGLEDNLPYFRTQFENNENARQSVIKRKVELDTIKVSVHIRRGDLKRWLKMRLDQTEARLVEYTTYTSVLNQLLQKLLELEKRKVRIVVRLYCEGMKPPASIPRATDWRPVDIREKITYDHTMQDVEIIPGSKDTLQAFDDMCFSDIFITGTSGFSYVVSALCKTPVILAVPFWHSYEIIPNAITLNAEKGPSQRVKSVRSGSKKLMQYASFDEKRFELLWRERFPSQ